MLKVVDVCTRIEGHGNVKLFLQNDEISQVEFEIAPYRGFENILIGKKLIDVPKIVSRICGLCHASQAIVSCKAIEDLYGIQAHEQSINLRRILMTGELIKSHSMHFFFHSLPDLFLIFDISQKLFSPYELIKYDPQLTTNLYELIKIGNDIDKIFGGRSVHLITLIPGGVIYSHSRKNFTMARKYLQRALINLEWVIEKFIELFSKYNPPEEFSLPDISYFGLNNFGNYDRYSGILRIKENKKKIIDFQEADYSSYFDKDSNLRGIDFYFEKGKKILVGPLSRYNIIENYGIDNVTTYLKYFDKSWKNNILFANFIRLLEMFIEINQGLKILEDPTLSNIDILPSLNSVKKSEGIGVSEAPRGILLHHYYINKRNLIEQVKLFIATEINIPLINEMITKYAYKLYEKTGDINLVKKKIQMIIRAFDPCIACATH